MTVAPVPIVVTAAGRQPVPPATINANLIAEVAAIDPGYTILPGLLIEDIASTDTMAIAQMDTFVTEVIDSISPYSANAYLLAQLGAIYGVTVGQPSNTSVFVTFTGTVGFVIAQGFTVSDGTYQYVVQDGGIIPSGGTTDPLFCVATQAGTWAVPANTVTTLSTSVPVTITLSVTNPLAGIPSQGSETEESYRVRCLQAGLSPAQGMAAYLRTLLSQVAGVQSRLIAVIQQSPGWKIIVGGGDPYQVAYAIWTALFDVSNLTPSVIAVTGITQANPGVVTTDLNHGLTTGQANVHIAGVVGMTGANGGPYTVTVLTPTTFTFGVDTTGFGAYVSGGVITPNPRNITADVVDYPDTYAVKFISPPLQTVTISLLWNTSSPFIVSDAAVAQLGAPAVADYINSIPVGQPINRFELDNVFQAAIVSLVPTPLLTRMAWTVTIDGVSTSVVAGTGIYNGDPESYFSTDATHITITQG